MCKRFNRMEAAEVHKGREMTVNNELIDRLLADYKKPEDLIGENGLLKQLTKRLVERAVDFPRNDRQTRASN